MLLHDLMSGYNRVRFLFASVVRFCFHICNSNYKRKSYLFVWDIDFALSVRLYFWPNIHLSLFLAGCTSVFHTFVRASYILSENALSKSNYETLPNYSVIAHCKFDDFFCAHDILTIVPEINYKLHGWIYLKVKTCNATQYHECPLP